MESNQSELASQFRRSLSIPKEKRSQLSTEDIGVEYLIPKLQTSGDLASCWYILLSGSVYLDGCMYLPGSSFGQQTKSGRRTSECLILERSEMIAIDYPPESLQVPYNTTYDHDDQIYDQKHFRRDQNIPDDLREVREILQKNDPYVQKVGEQYNNNKGDGQQRYTSRSRKHSSLDEFDLDLTGLKETMVDGIDSDDDDELLQNESAVVRDIVRDCLEKEPSERTENDIHILMDFMQHLPAFSNLSHNIKTEMCKVMVFAVVDKAGAVVMSDGEEMDSWSVILNGSVEIIHEVLPSVTLHLGDSFGVKTTPEVMCHKGTMKTRVDDCQFVCIAQDDYWRIFSQGEASYRKVEEEGEVVMVTEHRVTDGGSRQGQVVIKGTPDRLLDHLMEDHSIIDPTYVEDFLLTYVVFFNKSHEIAQKLLKWFERPQLKDKVTRVMLLWVNNHFSDFEGDPFMEVCMERFEYLLEAKKMLGQLRLLNMACSAKSKPRIITLQRPSKESRLDFSICGGKEQGAPIFIMKTDYDSKAAELGLKRGDQILEVNGQTFENISEAKASNILLSHAHLCLVVKANMIGFKAVVQPAVKKSHSNRSLDETHLDTNNSLHVAKKGTGISRSVSDVNTTAKGKSKTFDGPSSLGKDDFSNMSGSMTLPRNSKIKTAMRMFKLLPRSNSEKELNKLEVQGENGQQFTRYFTRPTSEKPNQADGNPLSPAEDPLELNTQVIKLYRGDHSSKYFVLTKDTPAREVIHTAIDAFAISDYVSNTYFLCEVTVTEDGLIKQKRLPDNASNLANRISLNGRYYIKSSIAEGPISDEVAQEISREANLALVQLSPLEIAKELTLQDFDLFRNVDSREYIYNLFEPKNERKSKNLRSVEQTTNTEMFWVISEIVTEPNINKRVKLLKYFIKVAKFCKDFKNYNSMYAIISGLDNSSVSRLKNTWERLNQKYDKMFEDLKALMDPSRNMSKYRNLFTGERCYPPLIPWFPIVKKDMTFLHLGNPTTVDNLVNFEKLRMIAREVRRVCKYCAIGYDPNKMDAMQDNANDAASVALSVVSITTGPNNRRSGRGSIAMSNPKKAYEEFQTSRRIRQYLERLSNRKYTEKELQELSYNCEPPPSLSTPNNSLKGVKKVSSPTPDKRPPQNEKTASNRNSNPPPNTKEDRISISSPASTPSSHRSQSTSSHNSNRDDDSYYRDLHARKKLPIAPPPDEAPPRGFLYSDSSSNGSMRSTTSTGSRSLPAYADYTDISNPLAHFDEDDHGQVSMV